MPDRVRHGPVLLLLVTGGLGGVNFLLGKAGALAGVSPLVWALVISLGAVLGLIPVLALRGGLALPRGRELRYVVISGLISFALANLLVYSLIPHLGAGHVGLMFALSPVMTLALSTLAGTGSVNRLGGAGIALGFAGAVLIVAGGGETGSTAAAAGLLLLGLAIPLVLAVGNVYRTLDWPPGGAPDRLAIWSHAVAALVFGAVILAHGGITIAEVTRAPALAVLQAVVAALTFPAYFRLQRDGGPVLLSQIGYVSAAVGLFGSVLFLGESYAALAWIGTGVVALGILFTIAAQLTRTAARRPVPFSSAHPARCGTNS